MRHDWRLPTYESQVAAFMEPERRICKNCGAEQTLETEYWYMRVAGRRWRPLIGRCKPKN